jgi:hypothetical protein
LKTDLLLKREDRKELDAALEKGINAETIRAAAALLKSRQQTQDSLILPTPMWAVKVLAYSLMLECDSDKDGHISHEELIQACNKVDAVPATSRPTLEYLVQNFDTICGADGLISYGEVWAHFSEPSVEAEFLVRASELILHLMEGRSHSSERDLFPTANCIQPQAIRQGFNQDCLFLAMLASQAAVDPTVIRNCIKRLGGTPPKFEVRFPNAPTEPFVVTMPTDAELTIFCAATDYGVWPAVLEKACGAYCMKSPLRRLAWVRPWNWRPLFGARQQSQNATYGGWHLFGPITRDKVQHFLPDEFGLVLQGQVENGKPVALANLGIADKRHPNIRQNHAYALVSYDSQSDVVRVYNPWGSVGQHASADSTEGFIDLTLREAFDTFQVMYRVKP